MAPGKSDCPSCNKPLNKKGSIACSVCKCYFHFQCAGITDEDFSDRSPSFTCETCLADSVQPTYNEFKAEIRMLLANLVKKVDNAVDAFKNEAAGIKNDISEMKSDVSAMKTQFGAIKKQVPNLKSEVAIFKVSCKI